MIHEIPGIDMPDWLPAGNYGFDIKKIIKDSLYYPSCGTDGVPVKYFMGNVYSFVYVDYGFSENELDERIHVPDAFKGYEIIHKDKISQKQLDGGNKINYPPKISRRNPPSDWIEEPFCNWFVFKRKPGFNDDHNPEYFSLLYLCSEAVAAYCVLYNQYNVSPKILCMIQDGHGFGGNWTSYTERRLDLAQAVFLNRELPDYLIYGSYGFDYVGGTWPEYEEFIYEHTDDFKNGDAKTFLLCGKSRHGFWESRNRAWKPYGELY